MTARQVIGGLQGRSLRGLTDPDGEEGDGDEDGSGDGAHGVGPAPGAVHQPVEQAQPPLEQRRPRRVQYDLEVALHGIWGLGILPQRCPGVLTKAWSTVKPGILEGAPVPM